jgi:hypothetical protein
MKTVMQIWLGLVVVAVVVVFATAPLVRPEQTAPTDQTEQTDFEEEEPPYRCKPSRVIFHKR